MGLSIFCPDESAPIPRATHLRLTCDGAHGLLPAPAQTFTEPDYVAQRHAASVAGWRVSGDGVVLGPCCKRVRVAEEDE
jgi:hypothetical protein